MSHTTDRPTVGEHTRALHRQWRKQMRMWNCSETASTARHRMPRRCRGPERTPRADRRRDACAPRINAHVGVLYIFDYADTCHSRCTCVCVCSIDRIFGLALVSLSCSRTRRRIDAHNAVAFHRPQ
jgi:hypothetical protein